MAKHSAWSDSGDLLNEVIWGCASITIGDFVSMHPRVVALACIAVVPCPAGFRTALPAGCRNSDGSCLSIPRVELEMSIQNAPLKIGTKKPHLSAGLRLQDESSCGGE